MSKVIKPKLDGKEKKCDKCGSSGYPYLGNIPPAVLVNYVLLNHATYLYGAVIKNIDFFNSLWISSNEVLKLDRPPIKKKDKNP